MKRLPVLLLALCLAVASALAENSTLNKAQELLMNARTLEQYDMALKKFQTADSDPGYVAAEQDEAIAKGIKECQAKIAQLSASSKMKINGSTSPTVDFKAAGGAITLDVSAPKGSIKAKSSEAWLTVETVAKDSITLRCAPNNVPDTRTATVTVSAGSLSVRVKATQEGLSLAVTSVEFGQGDDNNATGWNEPLYADAVRYVVPRITYTSPARQSKTIGTKIYKADSPAPEAYTQTMDCSLEAGTGTLLFPGYGASKPGNLAPGAYAYEVWIDDQLAHSTTFAIKEVFDGIKFNSIEFGSTDNKGNQLAIFGSPLYKDVACIVKPRVYYKSPVPQHKTVHVKAYKPDGSLWTMPTSPDGYTMAEDVTFKAGSNTFILSGLGWSTPQFDLGDYKYEIWVEGMCAISDKFTIKAKEDLKIKGVQFSFSTINGRGVITPRISYSSPSHQKKAVCYKYFDANGKLMKDGNSPSGYTSKQDVEFKQGSSSYQGLGRANTASGKFAPGTYNVEIWIDGKQLWNGYFEVKLPTE